MEVILLERIERLGQMGDVVKVKPGYARNFLIPQKKAMRATEENLKHFEIQRAELETTNLKRRGDAEAVAKKLEDLILVMIRQAGETGQLYGSVTARDIAENLADNKITIKREQVRLDQNIKLLGIYECRIALHPEVIVLIKINVAKTEGEATAQAKAHKEGKSLSPAQMQAEAASGDAEETASALSGETAGKEGRKDKKDEQVEDAETTEAAQINGDESGQKKAKPKKATAEKEADSSHKPDAAAKADKDASSQDAKEDKSG